MYYATFNSDGTLYQRLIKGTHAIPEGAVGVDAVLWSRLISEVDGIWTLRAEGEIVKLPLPPVLLTLQDVERLRITAYADPLQGSDRYFAEANRMQAMGESGWEVVRDAGIARYKEIQALYPWPEDVTQ